MIPGIDVEELARALGRLLLIVLGVAALAVWGYVCWRVWR